MPCRLRRRAVLAVARYDAERYVEADDASSRVEGFVHVMGGVIPAIGQFGTHRDGRYAAWASLAADNTKGR